MFTAKRLTILAVLMSFGLITSSCTATTSEVKDIDLNGLWNFAYTTKLITAPGTSTPAVPENADFSVSIEAPGYWDDQYGAMKQAKWWSQVYYETPETDKKTSSNYIAGVGWYKKAIDAPADWKGRTVTLTIGGARGRFYIFVNGNYIERGIGRHTPFQFDLTKHLRYGQSNELVLALSNAVGHRDVGGINYSGHQSRYQAGIFGKINLHVSGGLGKIDRLFIRPTEDLSQANWQVDLNSFNESKPSKLQWQLSEIDSGKVVKQGSIDISAIGAEKKHNAKWQIPAKGLRLWSIGDPYLYESQVTWLDSDGTVIDQISQPCGLRSVVSKDKKIYLNGRPVMFRGICEFYYFSPEINPPCSVDYFKNIVRKLKAVGYNAIRTHTWIPSQEYMQAADELGMMFRVEGGAQNIAKWREMILWSRIHPSVVIYCAGNEAVCDESMVRFFEQMSVEAKKLDSGSLVMPMGTLRGLEYRDWTTKDFVPIPENQRDKYGYGQKGKRPPYEYHAELFKRVTAAVDIFDQYSWGELSYKNLAGMDWRDLEPRLALYQKPITSHELGIIGCYLDLRLEERLAKTRMPRQMYTKAREKLEKVGRLHMAQKYYENSSRWQSMARKYLMENARKCPSLDGYDNLGGWDGHHYISGYNCGTLNELLELKPGDTAEKIKQYNGESVLLLDNNRKHLFWSGDSFGMPIMASLYGGRALEKGTLEWQVTDGDKIVLSGKEKGLKGTDGQVNDLCKLKFSWPLLKEAKKLTLSVKLDGSDYLITNQWDFWVFPKRKTPDIIAAADKECFEKLSPRYPGIVPYTSNLNTPVRIVSELTNEHMHFLVNGGKVVLLGGSINHPLRYRRYPTKFQTARSGRTNMDLATVIKDHPVFEYIPHEGFCDWQFESLLEGGNAVIFHKKFPIEFNPIVELVPHYANAHLQSMMWEVQGRAKGEGALLVATFNFEDMNNPAVSALLDGILTYTTGPDFRPETKAELREKLYPLCSAGNYPTWWITLEEVLPDK